MDILNRIYTRLYFEMLRIRKIEERVAELVVAGEIGCPTHLYHGEEAIAVGFCSNLDAEDFVFSTYRGHGHYLAKGGNLNGFMAELYGKATGCTKGRGGSMHLVDPAINFVGTSALVAGAVAPAVGAAFASKLQGNKNISVVFFGDGATEEA